MQAEVLQDGGHKTASFRLSTTSPWSRLGLGQAAGPGAASVLLRSLLKLLQMGCIDSWSCREEEHTMQHCLLCPLLPNQCSGKDLTEFNDKAKGCVKKWETASTNCFKDPKRRRRLNQCATQSL